MMTARFLQPSFLLGDLLLVEAPYSNIPVSNICDHLDDIQPGSLFIAREGKSFNPLQQFEQIISKQPVAVLCASSNSAFSQMLQKRLFSAGVVLYAVENLQQSTVELLQRFYRPSLQQLQLLAVTGTDGKSSVAMLYAMMHPQTTAVIGTLGYGRFDRLQSTGMTTPSLVTLYRILARLQQQGFSQVIMEVSSHAIDQQRIDGLEFELAIITNLGRDHLDYHNTLEAYHRVKTGFIAGKQCRKAIVNADDPVLQGWLQKNRQYLAFGETQLAQAGIRKVSYTQEGILLDFDRQGFDAITVKLYGRFNLYNLLAVITARRQMGYDWQAIYSAVHKLHAVPGRMEKLPDTRGRHIFIDFAHTANALEQALKAIRLHFTSRITLVFGCGGDRDQGKRPLMGQVAEQLADRVIITDDNPRSEAPQQIVQQIMAGIKQPQKVEVIHDRAKAIAQAMQLCQSGEVLLIAGKGHEREQIGAQGRESFHDATVVAQWQRAGL